MKKTRGRSRVLSWILALAMILAMMSATAFADESGDASGDAVAESESGDAETEEDGLITRVGGDNRYETMALIAETAFPDGSDVAVIATGTNFPDALTASSLAGALDAPIILVTDEEGKEDRLETALDTLEELGVKTAYITGGTEAVSEDIETAINDLGITTERIAGETRVETALEIADAAGSTSTTCVVATSANYPDALSASAYAYYSTSPIYLAKKGEITEEVLEVIEAGGYTDIIIMGGTDAVSESTAEQLAAIEGVTVSRIDGANRYATSASFAETAVDKLGMSYDSMAVATGSNYPDALTGSVLSGSNGAVLVLTDEGTDNTGAERFSYLEALLTANGQDISEIYVLGLTDAVSETTEAAIEAAVAAAADESGDATESGDADETDDTDDTDAGDTDDTDVDDTEEESGDASEESGDASEESGDASEESGDASEESGDASDESGDASEESGDASDESGDASDESGDASEESGDASDASGDASGDAATESGDASGDAEGSDVTTFSILSIILEMLNLK